jgi:hypothetical protein
MSKRTAALYGLLSGGITMSVLLNGLWLAVIIATLFTLPAAVRRIRARGTSADEQATSNVGEAAA